MFHPELMITMFVFFSIQSILFYSLLPTGGVIWNTLTTLPPTIPDAPGWNIFAWIGFGWDLLVWLILKGASIIIYLFSTLLIPFSLMATWPLTAIVEIPAVIIFITCIVFNIVPLIHSVLNFIGKVLQAIAEAIPF